MNVGIGWAGTCEYFYRILRKLSTTCKNCVNVEYFRQQTRISYRAQEKRRESDDTLHLVAVHEASQTFAVQINAM